jgi:hypothetical protein
MCRQCTSTFSQCAVLMRPFAFPTLREGLAIRPTEGCVRACRYVELVQHIRAKYPDKIKTKIVFACEVCPPIGQTRGRFLLSVPLLVRQGVYSFICPFIGQTRRHTENSHVSQTFPECSLIILGMLPECSLYGP